MWIEISYVTLSVYTVDFVNLHREGGYGDYIAIVQVTICIIIALIYYYNVSLAYPLHGGAGWPIHSRGAFVSGSYYKLGPSPGTILYILFGV